MAEQPLKVELEQEEDGRWLAEVIDLPGVLAYGATRDEALARAEALALRVIADRLEHGERAPELNNPPSALSRFVAKNYSQTLGFRHKLCACVDCATAYGRGCVVCGRSVGDWAPCLPGDGWTCLWQRTVIVL